MRALALVLLLTPQALFAGAWRHARTIDAKDAEAHSVVVLGRAVCFSRTKVVIVTCVDGTTGDALFASASDAAGAGWTSEGLFVVGQSLLQVYSRKSEVWIREVSPDDGAQRSEGAVTFTSGSSRAVDVAAYKQRIMVSHRGGSMRAGQPGYVTVIDREDMRRVAQVDVPGLVPRFAQRGDLAVFYAGGKDRTSLHAIEFSTGRRRWEYAWDKKVYLRRPGMGPDRVYATVDDGTLIVIDARTGRALHKGKPTSKKKSIGYTQPAYHDGDVYVLLGKLSRIGPDFKTKGTYKKVEWYTGGIGISGGAVMISSDKRLHIIDRKTFARLALFEATERWQFTGPIRPLGAAVVAVQRYRYNYDYETRLMVYESSDPGRVDLRALTGDTFAYEDGRLLGGKETGVIRLPSGAHEIDLLRPGHYPATVRFDLAPGELEKLAMPALAPAPKRVASFYPHRVPAGTDLAALASGSSRRVMHPPALTKAKYRAAGAGRVFGIGPRDGLMAFDPKSGTLTWQHAPEALTELLGPLEKPGVSTVDLRIAAVVPEENLVVMVTQGYMTNPLAAFDISDGSLKWRYGLKIPLAYDESQSGGMYTAGFFVHDGLIWGRSYNTIYGIDLRSGRRVIEIQVGSGNITTWSNLVFGPDFVVHAETHSTGGVMEASSLYGQQRRWKKTLRGRPDLVASPWGDELYLLSPGQAQRLDGRTGRQLASKKLGGDVADIAPVFAGDAVYLCGNFATQFYALDRKTLELRWKYRRVDAYRDPCPQYATATHVLATGDGFYQVLLDAKDGRVISEGPMHKDDPVPLAQGWWQDQKEVCFMLYDRTLCY